MTLSETSPDRADFRRQKDALRTEIRARVSEKPEDGLTGETASIHQHLFAWDLFANAAVVHCYVSALAGEVDTRAVLGALLARGADVQVPVVRSGAMTLGHVILHALDQLVPASMGLWEPNPAIQKPAYPARADLIIVPGVAFDLLGHRLGTGKGYYDRFLAQIHAPKVALVFSHQIVDIVPAEDHDVAMDYLISPDGLHAVLPQA